MHRDGSTRLLFYKNKQTKNSNNNKNTQWEKKALHSMHFLVLCYACMCLAERTSLIGFEDLCPMVQPFQVKILLPVSTGTALLHRCLSWMGHLGRKGRQVHTGSQGSSGSHTPVPSSCSQLRFVGQVPGHLSLGEAAWWPGVAHHPADSSISQRTFPTTPPPR